MEGKYIIGIDQSTQGTKALLFDEKGQLIHREDMPHRQLVNEKGWVSHDPEEIYRNTLAVVRRLIENANIPKGQIAGVGISNQRETSVAWNRDTGRPVANAIVWQCARAQDICCSVGENYDAEKVFRRTGLKLSPYFPASKYSWILQQVEGAGELAEQGRLCLGTIDTWLVYCLTKGKSFKTDYSNASRTQLMNLESLSWDEEICNAFGIPMTCLPEICDSDAFYGETDFGGLLPYAVPIHGVLGDSHAALFAQGCLEVGMTKATYGTGSSIMMNIGEKPVWSEQGVVTSLAWKLGGRVNYVLEGNINYTGAVVSWLRDDVKLIVSPKETEGLCNEAQKEDELYFVPAFTGLGAPYWQPDAKGILYGINRTTGRAEIVRAAIESIAYQIWAVVEAMEKDAGISLKELRVDGGATGNGYLMQFQSDLLGLPVCVAAMEEMSGIGAAYAAGVALGIYSADIADNISRKVYNAGMEQDKRQKKLDGWSEAVELICKK